MEMSELNPKKSFSLYKPTKSETKRKQFKKKSDFTMEEENKYYKNLEIIKEFNKPNYIIGDSEDVTSVLKARNTLLEEGLINPANKTLKKLDVVLHDRLESPLTATFSSEENNYIKKLQSTYDKIVEETPTKKYYIPKRGKRIQETIKQLGFDDFEGNTEEAEDEAIENNYSNENPVLTNAETTEIEPPKASSSSSSQSSIDNLFRTRNIDATPIEYERVYNLDNIKNPLPMSLNDNLVASSMDDVDSYALDNTKTRDLTNYTGLEKGNLNRLRNDIVQEEMKDLRDQQELMGELTEQIELLSGGMRDSLFNANDLITAKDNSLSSNLDLDSDGSPLSALDRGRQAQHLVNVNLDSIDNFFNNPSENPSEADKIGQGDNMVGVNVFRNTYGVNPNVPVMKRDGDIMQSINNRINIGEDWLSRSGRKEKGFITGEAPSLASRFENLNVMTLNKDFRGLGKWNPYVGNNQDYMLGRYQQNIGAPVFSDLEGQRIRMQKRNEMYQQQRQSEMSGQEYQGVLPQYSGVAPPGIGQLRQQEIPYKTPNRSLRGDAVNLIKLSNKKALELANEYAP